MRPIRLLIVLILLFLSPGAAFAVTLDEIVALSKAGISETVILAVIDRDKTIFTIEPGQLVKLKQDGLTDSVLVAMLKSGRAEAEAAANAEAALNEAWFYASTFQSPATIAGAETESTQPAGSRSDRADASAQTFVLPYAVPVPPASHVPRSRCTTTPVAAAPQLSSTRGIFFSQPTTGIFFSPSVVTDCQPAARPVPRR